MLPTSYRPKRYSHSSSSYPVNYSNASLNDRLRSRSRLTNLAVFLLSAGFCLSILLNLNYWLTALNPTLSRDSLDSYLSNSLERITSQDGGSDERTYNRSQTPDSIEKTLERARDVVELKHLVLVAGHAIWKGSDPDNRDSDDDWVLTPYQRGGSVKTFYKHIERGVKLTNQDPNALLIFSGGQTRPDSPPSTEAQSYLRLAISTGLIPDPETISSPHSSSSTSPAGSDSDSDSDSEDSAKVKSVLSTTRATTEEFALDSYENLIFGLARFREVTGRWPVEVTVVGFEMKRDRFESLHRAAIKYPAARFRYIGIDDEGDTKDSYEGERQYGYLPFTTDPYGCHPPLLTKRIARNPFARYHPYHVSAPEISGLLEWCPPRSEYKAGGFGDGLVYPHRLPWEDGEGEGEKETTGLSWGRESDR